MDDWGFVEFDADGRLVEISPDFCRHFGVRSTELLGAGLEQVIQGVPLQDALRGTGGNEVVFGTVLGHACLIRATRRSNRLRCRVIVRQDEIDAEQRAAFARAVGKPAAGRQPSGQRHRHRYSFADIIGDSPVMAEIKEWAAKIAASNSTVLLTGESGTGKELFAQAIHGFSARQHHPFVAVNCAAIPDELFESEVFGYEAGAFSGAKREGKPGKIELAQNGTLFLDEISELPYPAQSKLLRVLQEREVERLGGTLSKYVDIRIIAATNRDLRTLVLEGKFRQDLFYRLYVFDLHIPSLRDRKDDILPLAHYFIRHFNEKLNTHVTQIDPSVQEWLLEHDWPGNVRELKAAIERGMNMVQRGVSTLDRLYLSPPLPLGGRKTAAHAGGHFASLEDEVAQAEIAAIRRSLQECNGDRLLAAQKLKIHVASLYRKMAKYKIK